MEETKIIKEDNVENKIIKKDNNDIFITEDDTFTIEISYYNDPIKGLIVETVEDSFDATNKDVKSFNMTFKYPSQGDYETIMARSKYQSIEKMNLTEVTLLETTRVVVLMKKWSLDRKLTVAEMTSIDPKIVKAINNKVREKIGVSALI